MGASKQAFMEQRDWEQHHEDAAQPLPNSETGLTLSQQSFLEFNSGDIRTVAMSVVDQCAEGHKSWADALIFAKKLNELADQIKENTADSAANELKLVNRERRYIRGCEVNEQMAGVKYDYASTKDPIWLELNTKLKQREAFLKTIKGSKEEIIVETGEVVKIYEPVKSGKLALIIKVQ